MFDFIYLFIIYYILSIYIFIWVFRPFQKYFTYVEPIEKQRWAPGDNHLTYSKQNLIFYKGGNAG